ncbi:MAG: NADH-quinone oxidoreductase subunit NuoF [Legionellales bacterium]|nr:NADH-quinone oxidoreductase subunit NuoF [Legionellales bacterium]
MVGAQSMQMNAVCLRTMNKKAPAALETYLDLGGYQVWQRIIKERPTPSDLIETIRNAVLKGRGGAGFLSGLKMRFIADDAPYPRYLVCNSDEGEPGTCKDTLIMQYNPHQLLEGMLIACYAQGMSACYHYIRGEYQVQYDACETAIQEAVAHGFVGENILGSSIGIQIHNILGAGSYIVGEESAMLESLEGRPALPRSKPPFPAVYGLYGKPTTVNNTETIASIPMIIEKGADWFLRLGCENSGGAKIFCLSGHVKNPGVFEVPLGTPFSTLLSLAGGMRSKAPLKAIIPGGSSMRVLPAKATQSLTMDYDALVNAGSSLGTGGIIVMDKNTCMVETLACISRFYKHESCGQCTPCREGTGWVVRLLDRILSGDASKSDLSMLHDIAHSAEGRTICAFGEAFTWPVQSFLTHFYDEFEYYIQHKQSKVTGRELKGNRDV